MVNKFETKQFGGISRGIRDQSICISWTGVVPELVNWRIF